MKKGSELTPLALTKLSPLKEQLVIVTSYEEKEEKVRGSREWEGWLEKKEEEERLKL